MWRSTEVSISQHISMDHVLIKNVCILLYAWAVSPEMWNLWPTLKTALVQSFPTSAGHSLIICTNFLQYVGVCFGCDLLPTVTPAVIYLYVGKLPFYASIPARTTEERHWIMSSQCNPFSVKEIYFDNLELWTLWSIWMTGPLFFWPLVAGSRWFHESDTKLNSYILLFLVFKVWIALCYFALPLKPLHFSVRCKLSEYFWRQHDAGFYCPSYNNVPTKRGVCLPSLKRSGVCLPRCLSDWMGMSAGANRPYQGYRRVWMGQEEAWGEV